MINPHDRLGDLEDMINKLTREKERATDRSRYSRAKHLQRKRRVYIRERKAILYTLRYMESQTRLSAGRVC